MSIDVSKTRPQGALVLLSGGIDSTACVHFCLADGFSVRGLFVDYGQAACAQELEAARKVSERFGIQLHVVCYKGGHKYGSGEINGRNAFLLAVAMMERRSAESIVALGIHAGTSYEDCGEPFLVAMQEVFDIYDSGTTQILAPFMTWLKSTVFAYCEKNSIPISLTYSCENGTIPACGQCLSCLDREGIKC